MAMLALARSRFLALDAREQVADVDRLLGEWRELP
jgi:hypothetical protein